MDFWLLGSKIHLNFSQLTPISSSFVRLICWEINLFMLNFVYALKSLTFLTWWFVSPESLSVAFDVRVEFVVGNEDFGETELKSFSFMRIHFNGDETHFPPSCSLRDSSNASNITMLDSSLCPRLTAKLLTSVKVILNKALIKMITLSQGICFLDAFLSFYSHKILWCSHTKLNYCHKSYRIQ